VTGYCPDCGNTLCICDDEAREALVRRVVKAFGGENALKLRELGHAHARLDANARYFLAGIAVDIVLESITDARAFVQDYDARGDREVGPHRFRRILQPVGKRVEPILVVHDVASSSSAARLARRASTNRGSMRPVHILDDPQGFVDALVEAGVLRQVPGQQTHEGWEYHYAVILPKPPHGHEWRVDGVEPDVVRVRCACGARAKRPNRLPIEVPF